MLKKIKCNLAKCSKNITYYDYPLIADGRYYGFDSDNRFIMARYKQLKENNNIYYEYLIYYIDTDDKSGARYVPDEDVYMFPDINCESDVDTLRFTYKDKIYFDKEPDNKVDKKFIDRLIDCGFIVDKEFTGVILSRDVVVPLIYNAEYRSQVDVCKDIDIAYNDLKENKIVTDFFKRYSNL